MTRASSDARPTAGREPRRPDLSRRATDLPELMDDPAADPRALDRTFRRFALVNAAVSGWSGVFRDRVLPLLVAAERSDGPARVLDLGCGGGDLARSIRGWASAAGVDVRVLGADPDPRAIRAARRSVPAGVSFRVASSADLVASGERFDVVVSNHVLHHLTDADRDAFFADSASLAARRVVHSDIRRSEAAYRSYALASRAITAGTFVRVDGLRSIRRSYTVDELRRVLPPGWRAQAAAPHRVLAIHDRYPDAVDEELDRMDDATPDPD